MSFRDILDQDVPVNLLRNMLRRKRIPNGLLFWGPGGVGRQLTALEMAKAVNCAESDDDACGACLACRKVTNGSHPDVITVAPVKKSRIIDVETIHMINEFASLRAFESEWRVFIILEADRMGLPAQNHFLKTLEEPPGNSLFMLVTEYPGMLLPTIRSRCQRVRFGALRPETVTQLLLRDRDLTPEMAESIAGLSEGQMTRAIELVDSDKRAIALDLTKRLADGDDPLGLAEEFAKYLASRKSQIESAVRADLGASAGEGGSSEDKGELKLQQTAVAEALIRRDIMDYLYLFAAWYRDLRVYGATRDPALVLNRDQMERLEAAPAFDFDKKIAAIEKAKLYLERFLNEERVFRDLFFVLAE